MPDYSGPETAKGQVAYEDLSKLQSTIARRMAESKATAPHFYLQAEIDMSRAVEGRTRLKSAAKEGEVVPSFNDMVVKACALALSEHPRANGAYRDGRFELYSRVNVGIAVAARDALVVPTVFDADRKGLRQIATDSRALSARVRDGSITPPELSGATFTVSNLGMFGIDSFAAVINPPQAAILAVGAITERPVAHDGAIATAHLMSVNLACDHRILYGAEGAEFLARVRTLLEEPLLLALWGGSEHVAFWDLRAGAKISGLSRSCGRRSPRSRRGRGRSRRRRGRFPGFRPGPASNRRDEAGSRRRGRSTSMG